MSETKKVWDVSAEGGLRDKMVELFGNGGLLRNIF